MDSPAQQEQQQPSLCSGGCGFYGSSDTQNFCSVCWKSRQSAALAAATSPAAPAAQPAASQPSFEVKAAAQPAEAPAEAPAVVPEAVAPPTADPKAAAEAVAADDAPEKPVQENRSRCFCCRKKIGLLGFECRCGYVFCSSHRHAADHACAFDYATMDKAQLAKANNKVVAAKVDKL